jgi:hypothetical protein
LSKAPAVRRWRQRIEIAATLPEGASNPEPADLGRGGHHIEKTGVRVVSIEYRYAWSVKLYEPGDATREQSIPRSVIEVQSGEGRDIVGTVALLADESYPLGQRQESWL